MSTAFTVALVPAARPGGRLGGKHPKALVPVHGVPLVAHAVRGLLTAGCVRRVVVAAPVSSVETVRSALSDAGLDALVVPGAADRTESVRLALGAALGESPETEIVLVHDATRALTPPELVRAVVAEVVAGAPAVVPVLPVADTVKRVDPNAVVTATVSRADLRDVQSPQGFRLEALHRRLAGGDVRVSTVPGHPSAMRITTPFDLLVAEAMYGTPR